MRRGAVGDGRAGDPRLAPGGLLYRAALAAEGGTASALQPHDPPKVFEFPSLARGAAFILDPEGSGSLVPLPSGVERAQAYADAAKAAIAAAHRALNTTMSVIEGSGSGKWAVREGWAGEEWGLEGLGRAWKVREVLGGKYRSFHAPDDQVFFDLAEARHYGQNLSRLERMDYRFRRVTRFGASDASFASIDLANQRAVFSRPDSIYGNAHHSAGGLGGVGGDGAHAAPEEQAPVALAPLPPGWAPDEGAMEKLSGMVCAGLATLGNSSSRVVGHVLAPAQHGLVRSGGDGVGGRGRSRGVRGVRPSLRCRCRHNHLLDDDGDCGGCGAQRQGRAAGR